jgi:peptidyl-prolyl cis-trans isomerase SurA
MIPFLTLLTALVSPSAHAGVILDRLEASVNSSIILLSDVRRFRETLGLRQQLDPLFAGTVVASHGASATDAEITEFLVEEHLISSQFAVNDTEVEQQINEIQTNNHIDRGALKSAIGEQGYSFSDYFEMIRASISKRNLLGREIETKVRISDDDVKNYFYNHYAKDSATPVGYRLSIITVSAKNFKSAAAAKEVANRAYSDAKGGESFEEVAKRVSDGPTASSGGDLGVVSSDQMSPAIRDQAKKLKIGEISEVFGSPQTGYNIIKLIDLKAADSERLDKMKDEIKGQLVSSEYQHQLQLWLERQRQTAFVHMAGQTSIP